MYDVLVFDVDMMETAYHDSFFDKIPSIIAQAPPLKSVNLISTYLVVRLSKL